MHDNDSQPDKHAPDAGGHDQVLVAAAVGARAQAYCPYSKFAVGAAVRTASGKIYSGVNVENASYGLTICAERNAIAAAVAGGMQAGGLAAIAIAAGGQKPVSPCGACRQVIAEFAAADAGVISVVPESELMSIWRAAELLPDAFKL